MRVFAFISIGCCLFSTALLGVEFDPNSPQGKAVARDLAEAKAAWRSARPAEHVALRQALRNEKGLNALVEWDKRCPGQAAELTQFLLEKKGRNIPDFYTQKKAEAAALKRCHSQQPDSCRALVLWIRQYPDAARDLFKIKEGLGWAMEASPAANVRSAGNNVKARTEEKKDLRGPQSAENEPAKKSTPSAAKTQDKKKKKKNDDEDGEDTDEDDDQDDDDKDKNEDKKMTPAGAKKSADTDVDEDEDEDEDDKDGKKTDKKKKKKVTAKSVLDWVKEKIE